MIIQELQELFDSLKNDLTAIRAELTLINHDVLKIREQLDQQHHQNQPQESIGIAPNTLPPDFLPPELM